MTGARPRRLPTALAPPTTPWPWVSTDETPSLRWAATVTASTQATAWDAYGTVAHGLLPALRTNPVDSAAVRAQLSAMATRIVQYSPLWGEHGPMLLAALHCAMGLYRAGDNDELAGLAQDISDRLYLLSANPGPRRHHRDEPAPP